MSSATEPDPKDEDENAPLIHIRRGDDFPGIVLLAIRDEFAKAALTGMLPTFVNDHDMSPAECASDAYAFADAMMEARKDPTTSEVKDADG